ncbi:MAG: hypothetical protein GC171_05200 [Terrimonas sp.]|nr:hypothetical protein [Terrimonas sp.]
MKKIFSEKTLVLALFATALSIFYVANEDAKKLGVLQNTTSSPSRFISTLEDGTPVEPAAATPSSSVSE